MFQCTLNLLNLITFCYNPNNLGQWVTFYSTTQEVKQFVEFINTEDTQTLQEVGVTNVRNMYSRNEKVISYKYHHNLVPTNDH